MEERDLVFSDSPMFGRVMADADICKEVIERVLDMPLDRIEYINAEQVLDALPWQKGIRMDVYVRTSGGAYDVEMQTYHREDLGRRLRYYQASMDVVSLRKGRSYGLLPESYLIFLCDFDPFDEGRAVYTFEVTCLEESSVKLGHGFHWLVLNASAWQTLPAGPLRNLLHYISTGKSGSDELLEKIARAVQEGNRDAPWKERVMQFLTYEEDLAMQRDMILRKGMAEGIAKGMEKGKALGREEGRALGMAEGMEEGRAEGRAEGRVEGRTEGLQQGREEGSARERERYGALLRWLMASGRQDDIVRAAEDSTYVEKLYQELGL